MTKHTLGPWSVIPGVYDASPEASEFPHGPEVMAEGRTHIASLNMYAEADAALIAAAPDLLKACRAALRMHEYRTEEHIFFELREAIAKATAQ